MEKIQIVHTIRIKGLGKTFFLAACVAAMIRKVDKEMSNSEFGKSLLAKLQDMEKNQEQDRRSHMSVMKDDDE